MAAGTSNTTLQTNTGRQLHTNNYTIHSSNLNATRPIPPTPPTQTEQKATQHETPTKSPHTTKSLSKQFKHEEQIFLPRETHQSTEKHPTQLQTKYATFRKPRTPDPPWTTRPPTGLPQDSSDTQSETKQQPGRGFKKAINSKTRRRFYSTNENTEELQSTNQ
jgi:hypothetical protein